MAHVIKKLFICYTVLLHSSRLRSVSRSETRVRVRRDRRHDEATTRSCGFAGFGRTVASEEDVVAILTESEDWGRYFFIFLSFIFLVLPPSLNICIFVSRPLFSFFFFLIILVEKLSLFVRERERELITNMTYSLLLARKQPWKCSLVWGRATVWIPNTCEYEIDFDLKTAFLCY